MQDVVGALITHFKAESAITDLVSTRIWGGQLPVSEAENMPRKNVVMAHAGGFEEFRSAPIARVRVDIFSYGEGYLEAVGVDGAVADVLRAIHRTIAGTTLLHSAGYGGPIRMNIPESGWEYIMRSATIVMGETTL